MKITVKPGAGECKSIFELSFSSEEEEDKAASIVTVEMAQGELSDVGVTSIIHLGFSLVVALEGTERTLNALRKIFGWSMFTELVVVYG